MGLPAVTDRSTEETKPIHGSSISSSDVPPSSSPWFANITVFVSLTPFSSLELVMGSWFCRTSRSILPGRILSKSTLEEESESAGVPILSEPVEYPPIRSSSNQN